MIAQVTRHGWEPFPEPRPISLLSRCVSSAATLSSAAYVQETPSCGLASCIFPAGQIAPQHNDLIRFLLDSFHAPPHWSHRTIR